MTAASNVPRGRDRQGRATLSDLFLLVLGVALVLSLRWHSTWRSAPDPSWPKEPVWRSDGQFVEEAIEKTCLALIPLMLWRRARLGGACRPGELLLVLCGTPLVVDDIDWAVWYFDPEPEINLAGNLGPLFWRCRAAAWALCIVAVMTLILRRRALGDGARSTLMAVAAATSFAWLLMPMENLHMILAAHYQLRPAGEAAVAVAARAVAFLIPGVLGAAAARDALRGPRPLGGLAWAGLVLAACDLVVALPVNLWGRHMPAIPPLSEVYLHAEYFGGPLVAGLLGAWLAPSIGARWDRRAGP